MLCDPRWYDRVRHRSNLAITHRQSSSRWLIKLALQLIGYDLRYSTLNSLLDRQIVRARWVCNCWTL
jgi:hypothetical protein